MGKHDLKMTNFPNWFYTLLFFMALIGSCFGCV